MSHVGVCGLSVTTIGNSGSVIKWGCHQLSLALLPVCVYIHNGNVLHRNKKTSLILIVPRVKLGVEDYYNLRKQNALNCFHHSRFSVSVLNLLSLVTSRYTIC
jgi:hypothetical protein